jgi:hypothetical protein
MYPNEALLEDGPVWSTSPVAKISNVAFGDVYYCHCEAQ